MTAEELDDFDKTYGRGPRHAAVIALARETLRKRDSEEHALRASRRFYDQCEDCGHSTCRCPKKEGEKDAGPNTADES